MGKLLPVVAFICFSTVIIGPLPAQAGGVCSGLTLTCENGHVYPLCPIAVSDAGEIVTGHLGLAPRHSIHVRLVPMGVGYRYIGRGVWFDGVRGDAILYFGPNRSIACAVVRD
jgi:hypothetical protein